MLRFRDAAVRDAAVGCWLLAVAALAAGAAEAQPLLVQPLWPPAPTTTFVVELETNWPEATVYAGAARLGPASQGTFVVPAGTDVLRLAPSEADAWSVEPVEHALEAAAGDTVRLRLDAPYYYVVETVPFGAKVFLETGAGMRVLLGTTPLRYRAEAPLAGTLALERPGYVTERLEPGTRLQNRHARTLRPPDREGAEEIAWRPPPKPRRWIDGVALGVGLAAGALAVHYKFKANDRYDRYLELTQGTQSPEAQARAQRYYDQTQDLDLRAGVALGAMQVGLGVFAIRLVLR